jgi:hypothetical protein
MKELLRIRPPHSADGAYWPYSSTVVDPDENVGGCPVKSELLELLERGHRPRPVWLDGILVQAPRLDSAQLAPTDFDAY